MNTILSSTHPYYVYSTNSLSLWLIIFWAWICMVIFFFYQLTCTLNNHTTRNHARFDSHSWTLKRHFAYRVQTENNLQLRNFVQSTFTVRCVVSRDVIYCLLSVEWLSLYSVNESFLRFMFLLKWKICG